MPEYYNPNTYSVHLAGPNGVTVSIKPGEKVTLDEYFDKYVSRGFIKKQVVAKTITHNNIITPRKIQARIQVKNSNFISEQTPRNNNAVAAEKAREERSKRQLVSKSKRIVRNKIYKKSVTEQITPKHEEPNVKKQIVGKKSSVDPNTELHKNLSNNLYPFSNNIGIGVLSYNRKNSLKRLIDSIIRYTDLSKTTVFISDDCSNDKATIDYLNSLKEDTRFKILTNGENLGIAANTNRLLACLNRFSYILILNDDIEITQRGWEYIYPKASKLTNTHHFVYRESGVYGADLGKPIQINSVNLRMVEDKPHGALLFLTKTALDTCGYFNTEYGQYGMEHVDWSMKPFEFNMQSKGFYDVDGSNSYFKLHDEKSVVSDRIVKLRSSREIFKDRKIRSKHSHTVDRNSGISVIIPFKNTGSDLGRDKSFLSVVNNIRAQRFENIEIVLVEQTSQYNLDIADLQPCVYHKITNGNDRFNKSRAFNKGVYESYFENIVLHDADMLVTENYLSDIYDKLEKFDACHIGKTVLYVNEESSSKINNLNIVDKNIEFSRVVGYYEGGSLACKKSVYWSIGGFNEDYQGYGCEDCDFYSRLSTTNFCHKDRKHDLLHLHHGRVGDWRKHYKDNMELETKLIKLPLAERIKLQLQQIKDLGYHD